MSKIENDEEYEELLVPALPAYKALAYLDNKYGFYKKGSIIFYDIDCLYILNANGKVTAKREDEWTQTTLLVTRVDSSIPGNGMVYKEDEKISYFNLPDSRVVPQKFSIINNSNVGSETELVIRDTTDVESIEADQDYMDQRFKTIIYQHEGDNKYTAEMLKARMEEADAVLYLTGENMDIRAFTPNREYNIVFDDQTRQDRYGIYGYRIAYAYHMIRIESEGYMSSYHSIVLKRRSNDEESDDDSE